MAGDNTVDFANVFLVPGNSVVTTRPALVNLSGTNTLRLTVDVPQEERTKQGLMLNYLAFVPALVVQSSASAGTGYTVDTSASVDLGNRIITVPQPAGNTRFYRLLWDHAVKITSITRSGGNLILTYQ